MNSYKRKMLPETLFRAGGAGFLIFLAATSAFADYRQNGFDFGRQAKFDRAQEEFKKAVDADHNDSTSRGCLAALNDLKEHKINEGYAKRFFNGLWLLRQQETGKAIEELKGCTQIDPAYPRAYNLLGMATASLGKEVEAEGYFKLAIGKNPQYGEAYFNLASLYQAQGKNREAVDNYEKACEYAPDRDTFLSLGLYYASLDRHAEAAQVFERALKYDPGYGRTYYNLGLAYLLSNDYQRSRENLLRAQKIFTESGDTENLKKVQEHLEQFRQIEEKIRSKGR